MSTTTLRYVTNGTKLVLTCPYEPVDSWQVVETKEFLANCENGHRNVNKHIPYSDIIAVSNECHLEIKKITTSLPRSYMCITTKSCDLGKKIL